MRKDAAAGMAEKGGAGKVGGLVLFRHETSQRQGGGVAKKDGTQKRNYHIFEQQMPGSQRCCFFYETFRNQADQRVGQDQDHEDGRYEIRAPGDKETASVGKPVRKKQ